MTLPYIVNKFLYYIYIFICFFSSSRRVIMVEAVKDSRIEGEEGGKKF